MSPAGRTAEPVAGTGPRVLLVDDDRRVLELLEIAFGAHGFRVITAPDGDAAIQRALADRPDLVVLDLKLPRKSGLEVCDWLRRDPDDPAVPVIVVSAVVDPETRLQAFSRGADDYLLKPFSPKELIARVKRLLARSADAREARARQRELEREAARAREEASRALATAGREQRLRDLATGAGLELLDACDEDELAARLLAAALHRAGSRRAALLWSGEDGLLVPVAARGDLAGRFAGLSLPRDGALATLLAGLDRPLLRADVERFPDLDGAVAPFVAAGIALLLPLRGPRGLDGFVALDERRDGGAFPPFELECLAVLARPAAAALRSARRLRVLAERALAELAADAAVAETPAARRARAETVLLADQAAARAGLARRARRLVGHGILLGPALAGGPAAAALSRIAGDDPTGFARDLEALLAGARSAGAGAGAAEDASVPLLAVAHEYAGARARGAAPGDALRLALAAAGAALDPVTRASLEEALAENDARSAA